MKKSKETQQLTPAQAALVQRLKTKDWGHGILTEQDQGYIYAHNRRPIYQLDLNTEEIITSFSSLTEASIKITGSPDGCTNILKVCKKSVIAHMVINGDL